MLAYVLGVLTPPVLVYLFILARRLTCGCELEMARFGDVPLASNEDANSYYGPCPRCGKRYVKAIDWARAVIESERDR